MIQTDSLQNALSQIYGNGSHITERRKQPGGDINTAELLTLSGGETVFLKSNRTGNAGFFGAEAQGLSLLRAAGAVRVPAVLAFGTDRDSGGSFLLLEHLNSPKRRSDYWEILGRDLAALHSAPVPDAAGTAPGFFGLSDDNYIGSSIQINTPCPSWIEFFRSRRLEPQLRLAWDVLSGQDRTAARRLLDRLDQYLEEPENPSVLHGDLWGGNVMPGPDGCAWFIDPAAYVGHREADLAMTELFGGFSSGFYGAYRECFPLSPEYRQRRDLYNLYHLLNHLNLFGSGYYYEVVDLIRAYQ